MIWYILIWFLYINMIWYILIWFFYNNMIWYILIWFFYNNNMMWYILIWFLSWAGAGPDPPSDSQGVSLRGFLFPGKWTYLFFENVFYVFSRKSEFGAGFVTNLPSFPPLQFNPLHLFFQSTPPPIHSTSVKFLIL